MQRWSLQYEHSHYHVSHVPGLGTALCRRQEKDVFLHSGPGLTVSSQSLIQQSKPGSVASFEEPWLSCAPTCLSNRVQGSLNPEPSLCRCLRSLTTHSWPKIQRDPAWPAACPVKHPLYPALLLTILWFSLSSGSSVLCCAWGLLQSDTSLELAAISYSKITLQEEAKMEFHNKL